MFKAPKIWRLWISFFLLPESIILKPVKARSPKVSSSDPNHCNGPMIFKAFHFSFFTFFSFSSHQKFEFQKTGSFEMILLHQKWIYSTRKNWTRFENFTTSSKNSLKLPDRDTFYFFNKHSSIWIRRMFVMPIILWIIELPCPILHACLLSCQVRL